MIALAMQLPFTVLAGYLVGQFLDSYFETEYLGVSVLVLAIFGAFAQLIQEVLKNAADSEPDPPTNDNGKGPSR